MPAVRTRFRKRAAIGALALACLSAPLAFAQPAPGRTAPHVPPAASSSDPPATALPSTPGAVSGDLRAAAAAPSPAAVSGERAGPPSACGAFEFSAEVIMGDASTNLCPKPVDTALELLRAKLERVRGKDTALFFEVLRELRDHYHSPTVVTEPTTWRAALAQRIDEVLAQAKGERRLPANFAAVRGPNDVDPPACLFLTGDAGEPGHACYVLKGTPKPSAQGLSSYELSDLSDAYLAHRALAIAYSAMVKLDLPALNEAIKRLTLANRRWDSLRKSGYLQYPWELALSGIFAAYRDYQACFAHDKYCSGEQGLDPERVRLIALHPGVGMGFSGFGKNPKPSADATLALSLELLGVTYYRADFSSYLGASLGAVVNDGDFGDIRPGVFVHLTRWVHVGYLMSFFQSQTRYDATLFLSTDLGSAFGVNFLE